MNSFKRPNLSPKYFTSKRERFLEAKIPLRQGSITIPPEIPYVIHNALGLGYRIKPENEAISSKKKEEAEENYFQTGGIEPSVLYGSVARGEATPDSDIDVLPLSAFLRQRIALFTEKHILGAECMELESAYNQIDEKQESVLLDFMNQYGGEIVSSVDILLDYIYSNAILRGRAEAKGTTQDIEEALMVRSMFTDHLLTLTRLVEKSTLKKHGFHEYQVD